jgi:hypothetical protein
LAAETTRRLIIRYDSGDGHGKVILTPTGEKGISLTVPLIFEGESESGRGFEAPVGVTGEGLIPLVQFVETYPLFFMPSDRQVSSQNNAERFSELRKREQHQPVVEAVRALFPQVLDLSVEVQGGSIAIFASVRGLGQRLYIGSLSSGINKYLGILLALAARRGGAVVVDEVENGLYYKNLQDIWRNVAEFCRTTKTQLFASTHSLECLRAMLPVISEAPGDFSLLRAERQNGESSIRVFDGEHFEAALEQNFEIR